MATRIKIEVRDVRGPRFYVSEQGRQEGDVVGVVTPHLGEAFTVAAHATKPEVLTRMWDFAPEPQCATGAIQLIRCQLEVFPKNREGINRAKRGRWFELVVEHPCGTFFDIEGCIMGDENIARADELVKLFYQSPVALWVLLKSGIIWKRPDGYSTFTLPSVRE